MPLVIGSALLAGILVGWLGGGRLTAIGEVRLRWFWLVPVALGAQLYLVYGVALDVPSWVLIVHGLSYGLLLAFVAANLSLPGLSTIGFGLFLNAAVILANGGLMPQAPETVHLRHAGQSLAIGQHIPRTKDVLLPREATRFWWLSDHLVMPTGGDRPMVVSVGDVVLSVGLAVTVHGLMRRPANHSWPPRRLTRRTVATT